MGHSVGYPLQLAHSVPLKHSSNLSVIASMIALWKLHTVHRCSHIFVDSTWVSIEWQRSCTAGHGTGPLQLYMFRSSIGYKINRVNIIDLPCARNIQINQYQRIQPTCASFFYASVCVNSSKTLQGQLLDLAATPNQFVERRLIWSDFKATWKRLGSHMEAAYLFRST